MNRVFGDVLRQQTRAERITDTANESFVTLRLNGNGAAKRNVGEGKTPQPFSGYRVRAGQFIYSRIDARNGAFAIIPSSLDGAVVSKDFPVFDIDRSMVDPRFLLLSVGNESFVDGIRRLSFGATNRQRVKEEVFLKLPLELPPLDEQRRIAAILDKADELRTKRRQALAHIDTLTQSIFRSMFGTPGEGWRKARLDDICDVSSGITKGRKTAAEGLTDYPYLAVSNVQDRSLNMSVVKEIAVSAHEAERYRLRRGDPDKLGRGTIWNDELPWCLHQNHVFRVRPRSVEAVPVYLSWHLASPAAKSYFLRMAKQTTGIASINKTQLSATPVILPPRELQQTFAARVAAVERLKENHRKHLTELDALFASLQHRAFKGEL